MIYKLQDPSVAAQLFAGSSDTCITSALQGVMGDVYADHPTYPTAAMAVMNVFVFFAGQANAELVKYKPFEYDGDFAVFVPSNAAWEECIEQAYGDRVQKSSRFAICKDPVFDTEKLSAFMKDIPNGVELQMIDRDLYYRCLANEWSKDFVCNYADYDAFAKCGLGVVAVENGQLLAGASSFSSYEGGIEIEIVTHEEHRRKNLATACGAALILECLQRGLYPNWDAATRISVALAEKLGYRFSHEYVVYKISSYV